MQHVVMRHVLYGLVAAALLSRCLSVSKSGSYVNAGRTIIEYHGQTLAAVSAQGFHADPNRPVIDQTGFTGMSDIHLEFEGEGAPAVDLEAPSFLTAVQEQFGLRLTPGQGPAEVLVIDHLEHPNEN